MRVLSHLFEKNHAWATRLRAGDPDFFTNLAKQQAPDYLWIGCSDSRVPANQIVDLLPGEIFVHRNIANIVVHSDLNCLSVIQFAVEVLGVNHIIVCGHYGCGGIRAALEKQDHGLIDNWLRHIKDVYRMHQAEVDGLETETQRLNRLCELNIMEQVANVSNTTIVRNAWRSGKSLSIHGWVYDIADGILRDLGICMTEEDQVWQEEKMAE
ncbi:MAG: carbonate dehydratase [Caldilineaceae bacterium]|nr:carbonate dehydratase [Caldilineaceae bacterium]